MSLSMRQLEVIRAVCRFGSVTAAATALDISQPAISMMLRDCHRSLGFPLFHRRQGRLQPTAEMQGLLPDLDRVFNGVERIDRLLHDMQDSQVGAVQIAVTPTLADHLLPAAVAAFHAARPRIRITLRTMDNLSVVDAVTQEHVDFGLVLTPLGQPEARLLPLCTGNLICVVPIGHSLARNQVVTPSDLAAAPLISFSRSLPLGHLVEQAFQRAGVARRIGIEVNQSSLACALVRAGAGVAVIDPFMLLDTRVSDVVALPLLPSTAVTAQALVARDVRLSRAATLCLAAIRRTARSLSARLP